MFNDSLPMRLLIAALLSLGIVVLAGVLACSFAEGERMVGNHRSHQGRPAELGPGGGADSIAATVASCCAAA